MKLTAEGINDVNAPIWQVQAIKEESEETLYVGTGREQLFTVWTTLRLAIDFFIGAYPGTHGIRCLFGDPLRYEYIDLGQAARKTLLDGIMEKMGHEKAPAAN